MRRPRRLTLFAGLFLVLLALVPLAALAQEEFPPADGEALLNYILNENNHTNWGTWPDSRLEGFLESGPPHGGVVRIFVNDVALSAADNFTGHLPAHSIVVKENYTGTDPANPGDLDTLTVMYKVPGFAPATNDWFWLKGSTGGQVDLAGDVGMCTGCHGMEGNKDFILRYGFGDPPAVESARQLAAAPPAQQPAAQATPATLPVTGEAGQPSRLVGPLILIGALAVALGIWATRSRRLWR